MKVNLLRIFIDLKSSFCSYKEYFDDARWTGLRNENCTNPKLLYENSVAKSKDVVSYIEYQYFADQKPDKVKLSNNSIWTHTDMRKEGRCFTATPMKKMESFGIKEVTILLWIRARIYIHHGGFFIAERQKSFIDIKLSRKIYIDLDQEIFKYLNVDKEPCTEEPGYQKDACVLQELHNVSAFIRSTNY